MLDRQISALANERLRLYPAVAILGPRQVGKTTLVKEFRKANPDQVLYFDLENYADREAFLADRFFFLQSKADKTIILDEIQYLPEIFKDLRSLIDEDRRNGRFIILGYASPLLLQNGSESLTGRISFLELTPFLADELIEGELNKLWFRGGYPRAYLADNEQESSQILNDLIFNYVSRDLPSFGLATETRIIDMTLRMLASLHGNILSASDIANSLGRSNTTILKIFDFFESSFMLRKLPPWYVNNGKRLVKRPKVYIRDSGILHNLLLINSEDALLRHYLCGNSWEGFVIEQITANLRFGFLLSFYRTLQGAEIDVVVSKGVQVILAIEIKLSNKPNLSKGNRIALEDLGNPPLLFVSHSAEDYQMEKNIWVCSIQTLTQNLKRFGVEKLV